MIKGNTFQKLNFKQWFIERLGWSNILKIMLFIFKLKDSLLKITNWIGCFNNVLLALSNELGRVQLSLITEKWVVSILTIAGFDLTYCDLLLWALSRQDKKRKICESVKFKCYLNTLSTEKWWSCSFFALILSMFTIEPKHNHDQISINSTNVFNFQINFLITLGLMKSNGCMPLLNILH